MSKLITNTIRHTGGSADNITLDNSKNVTVEGNATVSGTIAQTIDADAEGVTQTASGNHYIKNVVDANRSSAGASIVSTVAKWNGKEVAGIKFTAGSDTTNKDNGRILFETANANDITERVRIDTEGKVGIGTTGPQTALHIGAGGVLRLDRSDGTRYGEIFNDNSFVELKSSTDPVRVNAQSYVRFDVSGSEKARIISGGGICFNGDTTTDNSLDDYEIGTFTVALNCHGSGSSGSINLSSSYDTLSYIKIGNLVHIQGRVYVDNVSSPQGTNVSIGTLPFVSMSAVSESSEKTFIDFQFHSMNTGSSDGGAAWIELTAGADKGIFHITRNDNSWAYISPGSFVGNSYLMFNGTYRTN